MSHTEEDVKLAYQIGYLHHSEGKPPLENDMVLRFIDALKKIPTKKEPESCEQK